VNRFKILSEQEVQRIHSAALEVLNTTGVKVPNERARQLLAEAGATVNRETTVARIPTKVVEECLKMAPKRIIYGGRNPEHDLVLEHGGKMYVRPAAGMEGWIGLETRKYRGMTMSDLRNWIRLTDALANMDFCAAIYPTVDVSIKTRDIHIMRLFLENTEKHFLLTHPYNLRSTEYIIEMALADRGSEEEMRKRPRISTTIDTVSPLDFSEFGIDIMFLAGKYGIPCEMNSMPVAGGTSPVTISGTLVVGHAEALALIVMAELANPGAPMVHRPVPLVLDMSTGMGSTGAIEVAMLNAAFTQLAQEATGLPCNVFGPATDSLIADGQSMTERVFALLLPALAGANIVSGAGNVERIYTADPVQLVIDNDIYGMLIRLLQGIKVDDDSLGLDAIAQVGPGGHYFTSRHTLKYFKTEYHRSRLFPCKARAIWELEGAKDLNENAKERAMTILKEHEPVPLGDTVKKEIDLIVQRGEKDKELSD